MSRSTLLLLAALAFVAGLVFPDPAQAGRQRPSNPPHETAGHLTWASPQSNPMALQPSGQACSLGLLLVANTTSGSVDAIDTATNTVFLTTSVGVEPVSIAFRPDGCEAWVSNHVSDSVSVIDTDATSASYLQVVETIQDFDSDAATLFDEPVGIAFASGSKAYVALSSRNQIAVVNAATYAVTAHITVTAQEPRAIAVRNGRLYVAAFESGNRSELSACIGVGGSQCTLGFQELLDFAQDPNLPGLTKNIVIDNQGPDRDLFVYSTTTDQQIDVVERVGSLLYGLVVDSSENVYITQTDALNDVNGITAPAAQRQDVNGDGDVNLKDLDNRMFLNQLAIVACSGGSCPTNPSSVVDLDSGTFPNPASALATPYGIALSGDETVIVATAAGTNRVFTTNTSGTVLDFMTVGAIPRSVVFDSTGSTGTAYVLNTLDNSVSVVTVGAGGALSLDGSVPVNPIPIGSDPTPEGVRLGRIAFNNALASTSGNFSCASCHPDGNTDQLLWRIGGECFINDPPDRVCVANEDEVRSTMPVRGLRDTLPLHWDGSLGDPFGGPNGAVGNGNDDISDCTLGDSHGCFRQLVNASLSGVMCDQEPSCATGPSGLAGLLTNTEREDLATFLERVSYPPARMRRMDDKLSTSGDPAVLTDFDGNNPVNVGAREGFEDFFFDNPPTSGGEPDTCADSTAGCHELPLGTATNSAILQAFDAPTMRGMTDRFLQFSLGLTNAEELLAFANVGIGPPIIPITINPLEPQIQWVPANGPREITTFGVAFAAFESVYGVRPLDMFQMFEEASTGHSGALGRQVTVNQATAVGCPACDLEDILDELEAADADLLVNLRGAGLFYNTTKTVSYDADADLYRFLPGPATRTRTALIGEAQSGLATLTLTAQLKGTVSEDESQPLIAPVGAQCDADNGDDPTLPTGSTITIESAYVTAADTVFLNGDPTSASITVLGSPDVCDTQGNPQPDEPDEVTPVQIRIVGLPLTGATDVLQILGTNGLLSNEMPLP